jgi:hypothetical protein
LATVGVRPVIDQSDRVLCVRATTAYFLTLSSKSPDRSKQSFTDCIDSFSFMLLLRLLFSMLHKSMRFRRPAAIKIFPSLKCQKARVMKIERWV